LLFYLVSLARAVLGKGIVGDGIEICLPVRIIRGDVLPLLIGQPKANRPTIILVMRKRQEVRLPGIDLIIVPVPSARVLD
jgi:hypothetical protein